VNKNIAVSAFMAATLCAQSEVFAQGSQSEVDTQNVSSGEAVISTAVEESVSTVRQRVISGAAIIALEEYARGALRKYGTGLARGLRGSGRGVGLATVITVSPVGVGSDIVPGTPGWNQIVNDRARAVGIDPVEFADEQGNLRRPGAVAQFEADLLRETLRRQRLAAAQAGQEFYPDPFYLSEINNLEKAAGEARNNARPFSRAERQMQNSIAGQTSGLASTLGSARSTQAIDPELARILATDPRSPFVATVETPTGVATGGFSGEQGLNVAGVLNVLALDSGQLQDGDQVRLTVRDSRGVIVTRDIILTFGGSTVRTSARRGLVNVTITALNEGTAPPNTGGLRVSGDTSGSRSRNFELRQGQSGTLAVRVLGN
jgi:hypothetical protein